MALKKLIVGNWKMNGKSSDISKIKAISELSSKADVALCLPVTLIARAIGAAPNFSIGAQDCHANENGAHTGCVSAGMLAECAVQYVIVGHSERRTDQHESNEDVKAKAKAVMANNMHAILCVGESEAERDSGDAVKIVTDQMLTSLPEASEAISGDTLSIAYEPIWAIGTGRIPSLEDVAEMHVALRGALIDHFGAAGNDIHILYGGSMNGENASDLLAIANVDGGLVGGASLSAAKFGPIVAAA